VVIGGIRNVVQQVRAEQPPAVLKSN
jgi:hypothetical protein